ncbi:MAG: hypothetical protein JXO44_10735 [Clostridia bacterium]|nr:hypothetical protein [Clostridia bacterium]
MLKKFNKSIDRRITFFVALVLACSVAIIGVLVYRFLYDTATDQLKETALLQTQAISSEVEDLFENGSIIINQLSTNKEIDTYLREVTTWDEILTHPLYKPVREALVNIKKNNEYYATVWIANERANFYFDDIGNLSDQTYEAKKRPWYTVAVNSHTVAFTKAYTEWSTGQTVLSSVKALRDSGEIYGFVAVDIALDTIPEVFYNHKLGYDETVFLISETGEYIYHPEIANALDKSILQESDMLYPFKGDIFYGSGNFEEVIINGKNMYLLSYPVSLANWRVVTLIDKGVLFAEIRGIFMSLMLAMLLMTLVMSVVVRYIVKNVMRPFSVLVNYGNDITEGHLDRNIPMEYIEREDDMGDLSKSFQMIIDTFRSDKVYLEEKLKEKNQALKDQYEYILKTEKAASVGGLVSGIAHEINTPLGNSITSLSYLKKVNDRTKDHLIGGTLSREELVDFINEVDKSIGLMDGNLTRAVELVENFKMIAVNHDDVVERVNLRNIISIVSVSLKHEIKAGRHYIQNNCSDTIEFESYPGALTRVFTNLIMNSLQHGFVNREEGIISIDAFIKDEAINILYKDDGMGMTKEVIENVYEPFYTTTRSQGNVGLGMAIVFNLVNQTLGGSIRLQSTENKGISVLIQIPKK